jgi:membrane-associated phospholipid phosphatase
MMHSFWHVVTRLGDAHIVLPVAALAMWMLANQPANRRLAGSWAVLVALCVLLVTATKVAFLGWGVGSAQFNFTGISGHASNAALVYPLLLATLASHRPANQQRVAVALGFVLALLVAVSRVPVGAHSWSEVIAGGALGSTVSVLLLRLCSLPRAVTVRFVPVVVVVWVLCMGLLGPRLNTHSFVIRLALVLSGNSSPYTRHDLLSAIPHAVPCCQHEDD